MAKTPMTIEIKTNKYHLNILYNNSIMTETNNESKRGPGRPKKYFTEEERKQADKRYVEKMHGEQLMSLQHL